MVKRFTQTLFLAVSVIAVVAILTLSLGASIRAQKVLQPVVARSRTATPSLREAVDEIEKRANLPPGIDIGATRVLLDVYAFNLDADGTDEQIVAVKGSDAENLAISIIVVDYNDQSRTWRAIWEGKTAVTMIKTFQVALEDLVGDQSQNIVCTGMNDNNLQTMTVFWRTASGPETSYSAVCEIIADSISITASERPESYKLGQSNAEAFSIVAFRHDAASSNYTDQERETYEWNFKTTRFEKTKIEKVPGTQIEQKITSTLLNGNVDTFKSFLRGVWYKVPTEGSEQITVFLIFDPDESTVNYHADDSVETYSWDDSHSTRLGCFIGGKSIAVSKLRRLMDVELRGVEKINVRVMQSMYIKADPSERWNGLYQKLGQGMANSMTRRKATALMDATTLSGTFLSDNGVEIGFSPPRFTYSTKEKTESGIFSIYGIGKDAILELSFLNADGFLVHRLNYRIDSEKGVDAPTWETVKSMVLVPVQITLNGPELMESLPIRLKRPIYDN